MEQKLPIAAGKSLFLGPCDFVKSVADLAGLPNARHPEIAFVGRSNVGKSSLINALVRRNGMARSSQTPGRTRHLNFFDLGGKMYLVDLPGYGYARASKVDIKGWQELMRDYLRGRAPLKRVCLLIDSRHGIKENDLEMMAMLDETAVSYQLVLTKADKCKKPEVARRIEEAEAEVLKHGAAFPFVYATSSEKVGGIEELRAVLAMAAELV